MNFAWSFSALSMFEQCRKKYFHIRVKKDAKDDDSQWAGDGKKQHDALKKRVIDGVALPIELRHLEKMASRFADSPGEKRGELQLAINAKFEPVGWFDNDVWCRAIIDLLIIRDTTAVIIDWKTGKRKDEFDQIKLAAAVLSCHMPEITDFKLAYLWTKNKQMSPLDMAKTNMPDVWADFLPRIDEITEAMKTTEFPATESGLCAYCPVRHCPHHKER
jgi:hypothetical protein